MHIINRKKETRICEEAVRDLSIKTPGIDIDAGSLSGGNQQKVVVGKWLARNSRVVIFDEPTRGIDVGAKVEIYHIMNKLKEQGIAVMFISSEMPEVMGIADRIIVMCDGRITGEIDAKAATQNEILKYATQFESKIYTEVSEDGESKKNRIIKEIDESEAYGCRVDGVCRPDSNICCVWDHESHGFFRPEYTESSQIDVEISSDRYRTELRDDNREH